MDKIDIKSLARELKAEQSGPPSEKNKGTNHNSNQKSIPREKNKNRLTKLLDQIQSESDFNGNGHVYIDAELYEVLRLLKLNARIPIGVLVSWLIEQFILEHKTDIHKIVKPRRNKYFET